MRLCFCLQFPDGLMTIFLSSYSLMMIFPRTKSRKANEKNEQTKMTIRNLQAEHFNDIEEVKDKPCARRVSEGPRGAFYAAIPAFLHLTLTQLIEFCPRNFDCNYNFLNSEKCSGENDNKSMGLEK